MQYHKPKFHMIPCSVRTVLVNVRLLKKDRSGGLRTGRSGNYGSIPGKEQIPLFSKESSPVLGPTQARIQWAPAPLTPGVTRPRREAGYSSHPKPGLRISEVKPPHSHTLS